MERTPEIELMDNEEQAKAYAFADFSVPHDLFIEIFREKFKDIHPSFNDIVLDLGCGPCDITRRFAKAYPDASFHALDGALEMLKLGAEINAKENLSKKITLVESYLPASELPQMFYHLIISNSLLHHLKNPFDLWETIQNHTKPYAHVFVMDLIRPIDEHTVQFLADEYAADESGILKNDFINSLRAAYSIQEVRLQLEEMGLTKLQVEKISDRHMIIYGVL